ITSYKALYDNAIDTERENRVSRGLNRNRTHIEIALAETQGAYVIASDYVKAVPLTLASWFPHTVSVLGTDGFGRSDSTPGLRGFFEVDAKHIAFAALFDLAQRGKIEGGLLEKAAEELEIDPEKRNPRTS